MTGFMTIVAALSYGELAAMMPRAGGQYVYLREALGPLVGISLRLDAVSGYSNGDRLPRWGWPSASFSALLLSFRIVHAVDLAFLGKVPPIRLGDGARIRGEAVAVGGKVDVALVPLWEARPRNWI